jgi:hypothetical protein
LRIGKYELKLSAKTDARLDVLPMRGSWIRLAADGRVLIYVFFCSAARY